jgi:SagB-type dehydrogenase family enzyme
LADFDFSTEPQRTGLLIRLDRLGLLVRELNSSGRRLVSCIPLRAPTYDLPERPPEGLLHLAPTAFARRETNLVSIEVPGSWAKMVIHDRDLLPLLHDLAVGKSAEDIATAATVLSPETLLTVLALMNWCELLGDGDRGGWAAHDLLFHARTRAGYGRILRGKIAIEGEERTPLVPSDTMRGARIPLELPDRLRLLVEDLPYAVVSERRQSRRRQGSVPPTSAQLSEFLFRTLHERDGRRPYPSGGARYPLQAYVAVHRCLGVAAGLYAYHPARHELSTVSEAGPAVDRLLAEAAGAAAVELPPQILLVLAARYDCMHGPYPDIAYSLILKEVGAVFQTAMLAAAAMGLAACPLGCGNSLLLAQLAGIDPQIESSVGELMLGSLAETA